MKLGDMAPVAPDALLALIGAFRNDPSPHKIDLGVGVYQDELAQTPIMAAIRQAHERFTELETSKAYLGPLGWPGFSTAVQALMFGEASERRLSGRISVVPTPGGSGALRIAGEFVKRARPDASVWLSDPTWINHHGVFTACGLTVRSYPYWDRSAKTMAREAMWAALGNMRAGDIIVFHGACHNPTGVDINLDDWTRVIDLCVAKGVTPLIDVAYQGLGDGFDEDGAGFRRILSSVPEALACFSFSKNMGLYRDRVGAIAFVAETPLKASAAQSHLLEIARRMYSMPPSYGAALAAITLSDPRLCAEWREELERMRRRICALRQSAAAVLRDRFGDDRFEYLALGRGMFSLLPLSGEQVRLLREKFSVHAAGNGRVNLCGLTSAAAMAHFARSLHCVLNPR